MHPDMAKPHHQETRTSWGIKLPNRPTQSRCQTQPADTGSVNRNDTLGMGQSLQALFIRFHCKARVKVMLIQTQPTHTCEAKAEPKRSTYVPGADCRRWAWWAGPDPTFESGGNLGSCCVHLDRCALRHPLWGMVPAGMSRGVHRGCEVGLEPLPCRSLDRAHPSW